MTPESQCPDCGRPRQPENTWCPNCGGGYSAVDPVTPKPAPWQPGHKPDLWERLVRDLADSSPFYFDLELGHFCHWCEAEYHPSSSPDVAGYTDPPHEPGCVWLRASQAVEQSADKGVLRMPRSTWGCGYVSMNWLEPVASERAED